MEEVISTGKVLRNHCQPQVGASDESIDAASEGRFSDDRPFKCYLACMMGLSHSLKDGKYQADLIIQMADDLLPPEISGKVKHVAEKCRNAGDGIGDQCDMAMALTKCAFDFAPEVRKNFVLIKGNKMNSSWVALVVTTALFVTCRQTSGELTLDEIDKAHMILRKHCQPVTGVSDDVLDATMKGTFADDRNLKCYLACIMGLSHVLKNGKYRADLAVRLADDLLPADLKDKARAVVEKCSTAADGLTDECEMAFAIKKCSYAADPEVRELLL
ncbi:hypothetical protein Cfor_12033 [Coptotermes formosanus]|uniref:Odorant binding protein n=1 Tax=Coptotermes formosanus TaxID=36987 RepID=A0A6L2Q5V3_COPFO|nr:hypothetical protein Cfor_12033 [Coptotermes formosanus]